MGIFKDTILGSLKSAFSKTRKNISDSISSILRSEKISEQELEEIENILLQSDFGLEFTSMLMEELRKRIRKGDEIDREGVNSLIKKIFLQEYEKLDIKITNFSNKRVIILIGINGAGKTTTLAKIANYFKSKSNKVIIGSCDTFRAAANEQLKTWATRADVLLIDDFSKDPSAVAFETIQRAILDNFDVALIDTAGRLHTNKNLIEELQKLVKTVEKIKQNYSIDTYLVVDGNSGQNSKNQLIEFSKYLDISGLIITKLDGTAKGGSIIQLSMSNKIPIRFLGVGEGIEDLVEFDANAYISSIIG